MAYDLFEIDESLEDEGVPLDLGGGLVFYVRSVAYAPFAKKYSDELRLARTKYRNLPQTEAMKHILRACVPQHLIARWDGEIRTADGVMHTCKSPAETAKLLKGRRGDKTLKLIFDFAEEEENFRQAEIEGVAGKLKSVSSA